MKSRNKYLCWVLLLIMLCVVSYGGCGGDSDDDTSASGSNETQSRDITPAPSDPSAQDNNINGTWHVDSGAWYFNIPGVGNYTSPYIAGSVADFEIAISKNTSDEYYTLKLSCDNVEEEYDEGILIPGGSMRGWVIQCKFKKDPALQEDSLDDEIEVPISGSDKFTHPNAGSYIQDFLGTSLIYTVIDNSTVKYRCNNANTSGPDAVYAELTLKRVN